MSVCGLTKGHDTHKVKPFHKSVKRGHDGGSFREESLAVGAISLGSFGQESSAWEMTCILYAMPNESPGYEVVNQTRVVTLLRVAARG